MFNKQILGYKACENNQLRSPESIKGLSQLQKLVLFFFFFFLNCKGNYLELLSKFTVVRWFPSLLLQVYGTRLVHFPTMLFNFYVYELWSHVKYSLVCYWFFKLLWAFQVVTRFSESRLCDCSKCPFTFTILEWKKL